jgi:hypothetical protein
VYSYLVTYLIATNEAGVMVTSGIGLLSHKVSTRSNNASLESVDSANLNVDKVRRVSLLLTQNKMLLRDLLVQKSSSSLTYVVPNLSDFTSGVLSKVHVLIIKHKISIMNEFHNPKLFDIRLVLYCTLFLNHHN